MIYLPGMSEVAYGEKAQAIRRMFALIAHRYDLLNTILSANQHRYWRRAAVRLASPPPGGRALDVATGSGEFALELAKGMDFQGKVVGIDFCGPILERGREKVERRGVPGVIFVLAAAEALPFPGDTFDIATIGFALRNVVSVEQTLREMQRVVRPGGKVVSLELTRPEKGLWQRFHDWYTRQVVPWVGGMLSGQRPAYVYLRESIATFMSPKELARRMEECGLTQVTIHRFTGGVATLHIGVKDSSSSSVS